VADVVALLAGIVLAVVGGELFVRGAVGLAGWLRVPAGIIGATVAAFATSSPELSVAVNAAMSDRSAIALGDALGSNVVNIALVLAVAIVLVPLVVERSDLRRNLPFAVAAPVLTGLLVIDGTLGRVDAGVLLVAFLIWLTLTVVEAARARSAAEMVLGEHRVGRAAWSVLLGLVLLVVAGRFIVVAAKGIGDALGLDEFVVGATLVALGTSTPELATTIVSRWRGHDEVGLGTIIGSNIFNSFWIVGVAGLISPITVQGREVAVGIVAGIVVTLLVAPGPANRLGRRRGILLLACYGGYLTALLAGA
jgi:cation:H+ antiporter